MASSLAPMGAQRMEIFDSRAYTLVRPLFSFRRIWRVLDGFDRLVMFVEHPIFRIRDEWILYADEEATRPLLVVKQRRLALLNTEHDIFDALSGERLGGLRERGLRSIFRDQWDILGPDEAPAGEMVEEGHAFLRRLFRFMTSRHRIDLGGRTLARLRQEFRFFAREFSLSLSQVDDPVDPRFAIACALIAAQKDLRRRSSE